MSKIVWLHAAKSVRVLFALILIGLVMVDVLNYYVHMSIVKILFFALIAVTPCMVSVRLVHSDMSELYYIPSIVVFVSGALVVVVVAIGCDAGWVSNTCFGGFAGPAAILGLMLSWAGTIFAFAHGSYKKMLRHGRIR